MFQGRNPTAKRKQARRTRARAMSHGRNPFRKYARTENVEGWSVEQEAQ